MDKHNQFFGMITTLICVLLMGSGCTEQNNQPAEETFQTILEKAAVLQSVYYELQISTMIIDSVEQTTTMKIWEQAPYLKEEINDTSGGITTTQNIIKRPEGTYRYDNISKTYELDPQLIIRQPSIAERTHDLRNNQTFTIVGTENISDIPTTIIQYHPNQGGNSTTITLWIWNDKGVPLKEQYVSNSEDTSVTITSLYNNYSFAEIPDSIFSVE